MGLISWILVGAIAGMLAKRIVPARTRAALSSPSSWAWPGPPWAASLWASWVGPGRPVSTSGPS